MEENKKKTEIKPATKTGYATLTEQLSHGIGNFVDAILGNNHIKERLEGSYYKKKKKK